jgi:hypothetical protein
MKSSQQYKNLIENLLSQRAGKFSPLTKLFSPHLEELREAAGLGVEHSLPEIIFNIQNNLRGPGSCSVCTGKTKLYPARGGWSQYCSIRCANSAGSSRQVKTEATKLLRGTAISSPSTIRKSKETLYKNYGVANPSLSADIVVRREHTNMEKHGVSSPFKRKDVQEKISRTMHERYGGTGRASAIIGDQITRTTRQNVLNQISDDLYAEWRVDTSPHDWKGTHEQPVALTHKCGRQHDEFVWCGARLFYPLCKTCHKSSRPAQKIIEFLEGHGELVSVNDRSIIAPLELDIVIPSRKIAIEVNGLYWHGETRGKDRKYHLDKTTRAAEKGYQLIHLTDIDVVDRWPVVKSLLLSKLGKLPRCHARQTQVRSVEKKVADEFLAQHHLQGVCRSSTRLGLYMEDKLVALMTFGKSRYDKKHDYELLRFASSVQVVGGASRLLSHFRRSHAGSIVSYADRRWSLGNLYTKIGFSLVGATSPSYWYFKNKQLHHRSMFQKHKLSGDAALSEWQLMKQAGWDRLWDCGSFKFILL